MGVIVDVMGNLSKIHWLFILSVLLFISNNSKFYHSLVFPPNISEISML